MKLVSFSFKEECDLEISRIISKKITEILELKESLVLGIPGGRSVQGIFQFLKESKIDWSKVHIFMVDERMVPLNDPESNFKAAKETFIDELVEKGKIPEKNIHPFEIERGIEDYKIQLLNWGGVFDVIILGVGEDGHVAALFPNHDSVKDKEEFFFLIDDSPKQPAERMTSSVSLLKKSSVAVVLFYGEGKNKAYEKFNDESLNVEECPVKLVLEMNEVYVGTDLKL